MATTTNLIQMPQTTAAAVAALREIDDPRASNLADLLDARRSEQTSRNYAAQWRKFEAWADANAVASLPAQPAHVAAYLADRIADGRGVSTLRLSLAAIRDAHLAAGVADPTSVQLVRDAMAGASRLLADQQAQQAGALTRDAFAAIKATAGQRRGRETEASAKARAAKDVALIATMRDALLRRSEVPRWSGRTSSAAPTGLAA